MPSNTPQHKRERLSLYILSLLLVAATIWIIHQQQEIQKLEESKFSVTHGMVQELANEIDSYSESHDPILLGQIYVRFRYFDVETQRLIALREEPISIAHPTTAASVTYQMMKSNLPPEQIATHLQRFNGILVQFRDRNVTYTDVEQHQIDQIGIYAQLCELSFMTNRELALP
jgi:hypothetical protein